MAAGFKALAAQPVAMAIILFAALDSAVYGASTVLYVPLSIRLGTGANGYGYLLAASALGGVLGAGLANRLSGAARLAPVIMGSICLQTLPFLVTIPVRWPALAAVLQAASGVGMVIVDVLAITSLQRDLPGQRAQPRARHLRHPGAGRHPAGQPGHRHPAGARRRRASR